MDELEKYLKEQWRFCNHSKYQKYFDEWFKNITSTQKMYFTAWSKGLVGPFVDDCKNTEYESTEYKRQQRKQTK